MATIDLCYYLGHDVLTQAERDEVHDRVWDVNELFAHPETIRSGDMVDQYIGRLVKLIAEQGLTATMSVRASLNCYPDSGNVKDPEVDILELQLTLTRGASSTVSYETYGLMVHLLRDAIESPFGDEATMYLTLSVAINENESRHKLTNNHNMWYNTHTL